MSDKRKALGRGLGALLPEVRTTGGAAGAASTATVKRDYFVVGIEDVYPSGQNPRQGFDEVHLTELADSIRKQGVIQPLVVRTRPIAEGGGYTLIAGERRWRAAQKAGLKQVPVVVKEVSAREAFELAMVENLQRADLNPIEEAEGYRRMCDEFGYTQDKLAEQVGKDRTTVFNALRLLKLPAPVRALVAEGRLQVGHAKALLGLEEGGAIEAAAERVVAKGLSVRLTEALVKKERLGAPAAPKAPRETAESTPQKRSAAVRDLEARLERTLATRVRLVEKDAQTGKIEIDYSSLDHLDQLLERLLRP